MEILFQGQHPVTQKGPWITVDGEDVADSQLSVEKLAEIFGKELYPGLDRKKIAFAESMRIMVEEYFYWVLVADR